MTDANKIQAKIYLGYGKAAKVLGRAYYVLRPPALAKDPTNLSWSLGALNAQFTSFKASDFNFKKGEGYDDFMWVGLFDATAVLPGDLLVEVLDPDRSPSVYFVGATPPLLPITCVKSNRRALILRANSQTDADGGRAEGLPSQDTNVGRYWGTTRVGQTSTAGPGELTLGADVPCALLPLGGSARSQGEVPTDAAGPARWRAYVPQSVFPKGSLKTGDVLVDDESERYLVNSAGWTDLGYRLELTRLEN